MPVHQTLAHFIIKLNGEDAPAELMDVVDEVMVETNLHLPGMFTIRLYDRDVNWTDSDRLPIGTEVEIAAQEPGASSATTLITGEITALEPEFTQAAPVLQVRGYDRAHRLHRGRRRRAFVEVTDGDIARQLAGDVGLSAQVGSISETHKYVYQNNLTNWEFLQERAHRIGYGCYVEGQTLHFEELQTTASPVELEWGVDLERFCPRLSSSAQVTEVIVRGWDPMSKREIIGQAAEGEAQPEIGEDEPGGAASESAFEPRLEAKMIVVDRPVHSQAEADGLAQAIADELSGSYIQAQGETSGNSRLRAGTKVNITGVGDRFGGQYLVTRAVHFYRPTERYTTRFNVTGTRPSSVGALLVGEKALPGSRLPGVVVGVVTNNNDPDGMGRVKVQFPWLADDAESDWARIASPMAGSNRGFHFMPEVNDEVLVAFEHDDINFPYIIGALWNGQDNPPEGTAQIISADGKVNQRVIRTREGHLIVLDDSPGNPGITVIDKTGNNKIEIDSSSNKITLQAQMDLVITAQGKVQISGESGVEIKSSGNVQIDGQTGAELKSSASVKVQGTGVNVEGGAAPVNVKGSVVNLN